MRLQGNVGMYVPGKGGIGGHNKEKAGQVQRVPVKGKEGGVTFKDMLEDALEQYTKKNG